MDRKWFRGPVRSFTGASPYGYLPALFRFPASVREPPEGVPWHRTLDVVVATATGPVLVFPGFRRATELPAD